MAKSWTERGGYSSYGKSALNASFNISGLDEFFEKLQNIGHNIDKACAESIDEVLPIVEKSMREGAERHRRTGEVVNAIESHSATIQGNYIYATIGIDLSEHPEASEAVFQEYGDGHSPEFPDPFVRPAIENNKREIKKSQKNALKRILNQAEREYYEEQYVARGGSAEYVKKYGLSDADIVKLQKG